MKKLMIYTFLILLALEANAESILKGIDMQVCNSSSECLKITSKRAEVGMLPSVYVLREVTVRGLGFENRKVSSVVVDFVAGQVLVRERKSGQLIGEWTVNMNTLSKSFSEVL